LQERVEKSLGEAELALVISGNSNNLRKEIRAFHFKVLQI
jgi:hypothetical protein